MLTRKKLFYIGPLAIVGIALLIAVGSEIVLHLWNWLTPALFGWRPITFWQALGILTLCRILFGGRGSFRPSFRRQMADRMSERMGERWEGMTPEERERFRQGLRGRCGFGPAASSSESKAE